MAMNNTCGLSQYRNNPTQGAFMAGSSSIDAYDIFNSVAAAVSGMTLGLCQASERQLYFVITSLIGGVQA